MIMASNREKACKIAEKVQRMIGKEVPMPDCALKKEKAQWDREEVRRVLIEKLQNNTVGPTEIK